MSTPTPVEFKIIDLICNLLKEQMDLSSQRVWIYNQKMKIPNDAGLFVEVRFVAAKPYGSNYECKDDEAGNFTEFQTLNQMEIYGITLYSRDESAFSRAHEVLMALTGVAAQQIQEQYHFKIGQLPASFTDTSNLEASANLFRQDLVFHTIRAYEKRRVIQYFNQFNIPPEIHVNP